MKQSLPSIIIATAVIMIGVWLILGVPQNPLPPGPVACTMEAKLCPDGSAVGRTGPNCEFAECPNTSGNGGGGGGIVPYQSGIRGLVILGPTCPVMRDPPDPGCDDRPYQTSIIVSRANTPTQVFARAESNALGRFEISLPPGDYLVDAAGGEVLPYCSQTPATVGASGYTEITVSCDTGIR